MDLLKMTKGNPFWVLNASPEDTRERLIEKQRDMAIYGEEQEGEQALTALLYPQSRLEAEMRWFPNTNTEEIDKLLTYVSEPKGYQPVQPFRTKSYLARFNALRLQLMIFPASGVNELSALIRGLSTVADALLPRQVMEEINLDRKKSGFSLLRKPEELEHSLTELLRETIRAYQEPFTTGVSRTAWKRLGKQLKAEMKDKASPFHNSYLFDLASEEFCLQGAAIDENAGGQRGTGNPQ